MTLLLPRIISGKHELSVKASCVLPNDTHDIHAIEAVTSFLRRSRVTKLFLFDIYRFCLSKYLASLHDLRVLILSLSSKRGDEILEAITHLSNLGDD